MLVTDGVDTESRLADARSTLAWATEADIVVDVVQYDPSESEVLVRSVYHLFARPVYNAAGIPESGHRSPASPTTIARRLMTIDVVLQWPDRLVLATEHEKVRFLHRGVGSRS